MSRGVSRWEQVGANQRPHRSVSSRRGQRKVPENQRRRRLRGGWVPRNREAGAHKAAIMYRYAGVTHRDSGRVSRV